MSKSNHLFIILLLSINLGIIVANRHRCKSIDNCEKCPDKNKCEKCKNGYTLNSKQTKCILLKSSDKKNQNEQNANKKSNLRKKTPVESPKKSSKEPEKKVLPNLHKKSTKETEKKVLSNPPKKSNKEPEKKVLSNPPKKSTKEPEKKVLSNPPVKNVNSVSVKKASNATVTPNTPFSSAFNYKELKKGFIKRYKGLIIKIAIFIVIGVVICHYIRKYLKKRKVGKVQYFYDPNGNEEKAKVVYIQ